MEERNEYEIFIPKMVDLGLPSGTLWADRNVGAEKPENYGDYFRFGEAEPFTEQSPKYNWRAFRDGIESTDLDAATVHFNRKCHTPTFLQIKEFITVTKNGRNLTVSMVFRSQVRTETASSFPLRAIVTV